MTKVLKRIIVKAGMTLEDVFKNGSKQQKKIACVFDSNSDGKFDEKEATLFNMTSTSEDAEGNITFWTRTSSGRKIKNIIAKDDLKSQVLESEQCKFTTKERKNGKIYRTYHNEAQVNKSARTILDETFIPSGDYNRYNMKLVSTNPVNGQKRYESDDIEFDIDEQKSIKVKKYIVTDIYDRVIEKKEFETCGEADVYDGYTIQKGNLTTHYSADNKKLGSVETDDTGKDKVMDKDGNILYYVKKGRAESSTEFYDKDNKLAFETYIYYGEYGSVCIYMAAEYDKDGKVIKSGKYCPDFTNCWSHENWFNNLDYFRPDFQE